jgi:hypothetical protein
MTPAQYVTTQRQWMRPLRIAHARFMLSKADTDLRKLWWRSVLELYDA